MTNSISKPYHQLPVILFLYLQMLSLGVYIIFFLITFLTFDPQPFIERSIIFHQSLKIVLLGGSITLALLGLFIFQSRYSQKNTFALLLPHGKEEIRWLLIFLSSLGVILILHYWEIDLHLISFLVFLGSLTYLFHLAQYYTFSFDRPSWQHPSTAGAIIEGSIILGLSLALWIFKDQDLQKMLLFTLLIILILEGLTLWGRFRFLSKSNHITQKTVRMLLGSYLALFGVRFIFGLVMPVVYLIWILFHW